MSPTSAYFHVIMPVGSDPLYSAKRHAIQKASQASGFDVKFPDFPSASSTHNIDALEADIRGATFVLADLSLARPSCYYELGVAEAHRKLIKLIAQCGTELHQMSNRSHTLFYEDISGLERLVSTIIEGIIRQTE